MRCGLPSADSGLQLVLEIALSDVSAKVQPHGLLQPGRRYVETSGDVIKGVPNKSKNNCRAKLERKRRKIISYRA